MQTADLRPIHVSEGLPKASDLDGEGRCWWGAEGDAYCVTRWRLEAPEDGALLMPGPFWLPHDALPIPRYPQ